uniref:Uncharacterized protein n=1 Tax=Anguilla anguilla TaxID=7936 RepID=A0A0E9T842_ANGAN
MHSFLICLCEQQVVKKFSHSPTLLLHHNFTIRFPVTKIN